MGGLAFPTSPADLSDNWRTGTGYQFDFEYPIEVGEVSILGSYHSASFPFDQAGFLGQFDRSQGPSVISSVKGPDASMWGITIGGKLNERSGVLYIRFDLGYFKLSRGNVTVSGPDKTVIQNFISKTGTLINLGAGVNVPLTDWLCLHFEGNYYWAQSDKDQPTGYTLIYSPGGTQTERKNTWIGGLKSGLSVRI
jgi:hypothetical protein